MTPSQTHVAAFLRLIRFAEHHRDSPDVYYLLYGGQQRFTDTSKHPNRAITRWGHTSTAAGAYQILYATWKEAKDRHVVNDFSPAAQDTLALARIRQRHASRFVEVGDIEHAIPLLRQAWTSLPGAAQAGLSMQKARALFDRYVQKAEKP